ncbi:PTS transporter subunit EIIC, partial [Streptococcus sp. 11273D007BT]
MDYKGLAQEILKQVGGEENVSDLTHCATRLRFRLVDEKKANDTAVEALEGVLGLTKSGGQYQVVIGNDVPHVYAALVDNLSDQSVRSTEVKQGPLQTLLAVISGIFTPILPVITAAGMIKAVLSLLTVFGVVTADDVNYQILNFIGDAGFYFLPIFLGASAARQFKTNPQLGMLMGAILLHPTFTLMVTTAKEAGKSLSFFSLPLTLASYSSTVIPVILAVWFMSYVERFADKVSPKAVKFFLVPMVTTLITALVTLLVLGPI